MLTSRTKEIVTTIVAFETVLPADVLFVNSKLATFAYEIDGIVYNSENTIQVPMKYRLGDELNIKYEVEAPTKIHRKHLFVV